MRTLKIIATLLLTSVLISSCYDDLKMVTVKTESSKILKLDKSGVEIEVTVRINNPNPFSFNIYKSNLQAALNGLDLGEVKVNRKIHVKRKSNDTHTFKVATDFSKLNMADMAKLMQIGTSKSATLHLKGELKVGKFFYKKKMPIDKKEKISF